MMMRESNPVETIYLQNNTTFVKILCIIADKEILSDYHTVKLIVENAADSFAMRIAIRYFLINYWFAHENGDYYTGNDHRTSQRIED